MRPQSSIKQTSVRWKNYIEVQTPWTDYRGQKSYAKSVLEEQNGELKEIMHTGFSKRLTKKQLKMDLKEWITVVMPMLEKERLERKNKND